MLEPATLRERLSHELRSFDTVSGAVFTSFNFSPDFFEQNILPVLFGIEGRGRNRLRVQVNARLATSPVAVFFDASTEPRGGGEFSYQAVSVRVNGGVFHPKLILVAGTRGKKPAVLVFVTSANLSVGGWGRNEEVAGAFWLEMDSQKAELQVLLSYLEAAASKAAVRARPGEAGDLPHHGISGLAVLRTAVDGADTRRAGKDDPDFHVFGVREYRDPESEGAEERSAPRFINPHRARWHRLTIFSPYWSNAEATRGLAKQMRADVVRLVIAPQQGGHPQTLEIDDSGALCEFQVASPSGRFRHAKMYVAERRKGHSHVVRIALGSANMTTAALGQPGAKTGSMGPTTNVEALVAFTVTGRALASLIPKLVQAADFEGSPANDPAETDERPPLEILVCYDWTLHEYRISLSVDRFASTGVPRATDTRLNVPEHSPIALEQGETVYPAPNGPGVKRDYRLTVNVANALGEVRERHYSGIITELGLDESSHNYTPALALDDFFSSWAVGREELLYSRLLEGVADDEESEDASLLGAPLVGATEQLDATNLFEIYRNLYTLERGQLQVAAAAEDHRRLSEFLFTRPDSIAALVRLLEDQKTQPAVRFALLLECQRLLETYDQERGAAQKPVRDRLRQRLESERTQLAEQMNRPGTQQQGVGILEWFDDELRKAWL